MYGGYKNAIYKFAQTTQYPLNTCKQASKRSRVSERHTACKSLPERGVGALHKSTRVFLYTPSDLRSIRLGKRGHCRRKPGLRPFWCYNIPSCVYMEYEYKDDSNFTVKSEST